MTKPTISTPRLGAVIARALSPWSECFFTGGRGSGHCGTNGLKRWPACNHPVPRHLAVAGTWHDRPGFPAFATFPPLAGDGDASKGDLVLAAQRAPGAAQARAERAHRLLAQHVPI